LINSLPYTCLASKLPSFKCISVISLSFNLSFFGAVSLVYIGASEAFAYFLIESITSSDLPNNFLTTLAPLVIYPPVNPGITKPKLAKAIPPKSLFVRA
jgi:hypothetical protein